MQKGKGGGRVWSRARRTGKRSAYRRIHTSIPTHTHTPTADARLLGNATAFMTDVGMCGPYASVIGMQADVAVRRIRTGERVGREVASGDVRLCGALVDTCDESGRATAIRAVQEPVG